MRRRTWASIILLAAFAVVLARVGSAYRERHLKAGVQPASAPTAAMDAPTATIKDLMDSTSIHRPMSCGTQSRRPSVRVGRARKSRRPIRNGPTYARGQSGSSKRETC